MIMKKIGCIGKKFCKGLWKGIKDNREEIITLSLVVIPALLIQDTSFATVQGTNVTPASNITISPIAGPIETLAANLTGPIPKIGSTIAIAVGGLGWAMGTEQQITKFATRAAVGGGIAVGGGTMVNEVLNPTSSCLF